jgi:hypothetical protein
MKYVSLPHNKKLNLLRQHSVGCDWPDLEQENWCLHCRKKLDGHSVRVWQDDKDSLWLECGTPDCDGSPIDWAPFPWWNPKHPASKAHKKSKPKRGSEANPPKADFGDDVPF